MHTHTHTNVDKQWLYFNSKSISMAHMMNSCKIFSFTHARSCFCQVDILGTSLAIMISWMLFFHTNKATVCFLCLMNILADEQWQCMDGKIETTCGSNCHHPWTACRQDKYVLRDSNCYDRRRGKLGWSKGIRQPVEQEFSSIKHLFYVPPWWGCD